MIGDPVENTETPRFATADPSERVQEQTRSLYAGLGMLLEALALYEVPYTPRSCSRARAGRGLLHRGRSREDPGRDRAGPGERTPACPIRDAIHYQPDGCTHPPGGTQCPTPRPSPCPCFWPCSCRRPGNSTTSTGTPSPTGSRQDRHRAGPDQPRGRGRRDARRHFQWDHQRVVGFYRMESGGWMTDQDCFDRFDDAGSEPVWAGLQKPNRSSIPTTTVVCSPPRTRTTWLSWWSDLAISQSLPVYVRGPTSRRATTTSGWSRTARTSARDPALPGPDPSGQEFG